jgi:hypothetical protein
MTNKEKFNASYIAPKNFNYFGRPQFQAVFRIRMIRKFSGHPDPLVRGTLPDPSIIKQK